MPYRDEKLIKIICKICKKEKGYYITDINVSEGVCANCFYEKIKGDKQDEPL
ncbi:hypothetical protein KAR91_14340 [Candidatus Pacearchaeota archaeon]|nr:hypothetical protein [Candidatus Pacearchaeota archaeon]